MAKSLRVVSIAELKHLAQTVSPIILDTMVRVSCAEVLALIKCRQEDDVPCVEGLPGTTARIPLTQLTTELPVVYGIFEEDLCCYVGQTSGLSKRVADSHEHYRPGRYFKVLSADTLLDERAERLEVEGKFIRKFILDGHPLANRCHHAKVAREELLRRRGVTVTRNNLT